MLTTWYVQVTEAARTRKQLVPPARRAASTLSCCPTRPYPADIVIVTTVCDHAHMRTRRFRVCAVRLVSLQSGLYGESFCKCECPKGVCEVIGA